VTGIAIPPANDLNSPIFNAPAAQQGGFRTGHLGAAARRCALCGQNVSVTDVSIYVALITGAAGAIGATVPQLATVFGENRREKRAREERGASARQQSYVELLGAAADLRTRVANTAMYHGSEMPVRLADIRSSAADVQVKAAKVAFLAAGLSVPAHGLGSAASELAANAVSRTDMTTNVMNVPDFKAFDTAVTNFNTAALAGSGTVAKAGK
jgi:hypothetical protein